MIGFSFAFVWTGGALFVAALAYCAYSYAVPWGRPSAFDVRALGIDALLFSAFALHHSLFARDATKRWAAHAVPSPLLRSFYVWLASALLILMCAAWQPIGGDGYHHTGALALVHAVIQVAGVAIIAQSVRAIDPLELSGIRQADPATESSLQTSGPYGWVRHPLYSGWLLLTFGAANMTGDRLFFAGIALLYLLIAMPFEERSLLKSFGASYDEYRRVVRYRLVPYVY